VTADLEEATMHVHEFMTAPAVTVRTTMSIADVGRLLLHRDITAAPVVDRNGVLMGIVSRSDLIRERVEQDPDSHVRSVHSDRPGAASTVADVMTRDVVTLPLTADEAEFADLVLKHRVKSVPVLDENRQVLGIVSVSDLLKSRTRRDDEIADEVRALLLKWVSGQESWRVRVHEGIVTITGSVPSRRQSLMQVVTMAVPGVVRVTFRSGDRDLTDLAP
jgi:CBS domain-containing protein